MALCRACCQAEDRTLWLGWSALRHSVETLAVQAFPLSDVKAYMGHAKSETTMTTCTTRRSTTRPTSSARS